MNESILSKENPPRVGDVLKHNGWRLVQCEGSVGWWGDDSNYQRVFPYIALYGLPVLRPAEKVTGELVGIIERHDDNVWKIRDYSVATYLNEYTIRGKRVALVILEDN